MEENNKYYVITRFLTSDPTNQHNVSNGYNPGNFIRNIISGSLFYTISDGIHINVTDPQYKNIIVDGIELIGLTKAPTPTEESPDTSIVNKKYLLETIEIEKLERTEEEIKIYEEINDLKNEDLSLDEKITNQKNELINAIESESNTRISSDNTLNNKIQGLASGSLGAIVHSAAAPTPAASGYYEFSTAGSCAWITGGAVTVKAGDRVSVNYTAPSTYVYTYIAVELGTADFYNVTARVPLAAGQFYTATTARAAVPTNIRKLGLTITYATASGVWVEEKYIGSDVANWADEGNWDNNTDTTYINDINNLQPYSLGKAKVFTSGTTVTAQRCGATVPANYKNTLKVRLTATKNTLNGLLFVEKTGIVGLVSTKTIIWVADGFGGYYFEHIFTNVKLDVVTYVACQLSSAGALSEDVSIVFTEIAYSAKSIDISVENKDKIDVITPEVSALRLDVDTLNTKQLEIDESLKESDLDLSVYADKQTLLLTNGQTSAGRITWTIPISKLKVGDIINIKVKSQNGANATKVGVFKYTSTYIGAITWTLNTSDGYYYSQLIEIQVTQSDIDTLQNFNVIIQAYNASGLSADVITNVTQFVFKSSYININELVQKVDDMAVPSNLLNTLELDWRRYSSMTHIDVKKDGTGDFTTIQEAINSITDAAINNQYDIRVWDDHIITDVAQLWMKNATYSHPNISSITENIALVITKDYVHIRGIGRKIKLHVISQTTLAASAYQYIQVIYPQGNSILSDLEVAIKGGRYAIHQEAGGAKTSPDYNATTIYNNVTRIHLGNSTSDGYPSGIWTSTMAQADGTTSGYKRVDIGGEFISENSTPFYFHSNKDYDERTEHYFINCKIRHLKGISIKDMGSNYGDIGSGKRAIINFVGCDLKRFDISSSMRSTEEVPTAADLYINGGADLLGHSNTKTLCQNETPKTLYFNAVSVNESLSIIGGTAYNDIWGGILFETKHRTDAAAQVWGAKRIELPQLSLGSSYIYSLAYRLGNCATTPKTLILNVNGTEYTITFNKNYMTADGSAYSWNTTPAITQDQILADINASYPTVFQVSHNIQYKIYTFADCMEAGVNATANTISVGKLVVRDYANGANAWKLAQVGDIAEGIAGERLVAASGTDIQNGNIIMLNKAYFTSWRINLGTGLTVGTYYKCAANGGLTTTTVRSEASLVVVDSETLTGI